MELSRKTPLAFAATNASPLECHGLSAKLASNAISPVAAPTPLAFWPASAVVSSLNQNLSGPAVEVGAPSACEWWLLPVRADGEPDLARASFPLVAQRDRWPQPFRFGERRWSRAFDRAQPLDESLLLGEEPRAELPPQPVAAASPAPLTAIAPCGGEGRARSPVLDRFDQWEEQIVGPRRSLDRIGWTVDAGAWSGHCQELDVLRAALEQTLGCALAQEGRCIGAGVNEDSR